MCNLSCSVCLQQEGRDSGYLCETMVDDDGKKYGNKSRQELERASNKVVLFNLGNRQLSSSAKNIVFWRNYFKCDGDDGMGPTP